MAFMRRTLALVNARTKNGERILCYQWRQLGRRLAKCALSISTRQMAHVVSTAVGSVAASNTLENLNAGAASRRAASAAAAAACACTCSVDSSESCADDFNSKRAQTSTTTRPAQIIKIRGLIMACFSVIGVGLGVANKFSAAITETIYG